MKVKIFSDNYKIAAETKYDIHALCSFILFEDPGKITRRLKVLREKELIEAYLPWHAEGRWFVDKIWVTAPGEPYMVRFSNKAPTNIEIRQ